MTVDLWTVAIIAIANAFTALMSWLSRRNAAAAAVAANSANINAAAAVALAAETKAVAEQIKKQTDGLTTALVAKTAIIAKAEGKAEGIAEEKANGNGHPKP